MYTICHRRLLKVTKCILYANGGIFTLVIQFQSKNFQTEIDRNLNNTFVAIKQIKP